MALAQQPAAAPQAAPYLGSVPTLNRAQIDALLARPDKLLIIDVRRPDEVATIGGFPVYLNIQAKDIERHSAFIPRERTIVTVSNHAGRALRAADVLLAKGFKVAGAIGAQNYEKDGGALTITVKPPARP